MSGLEFLSGIATESTLDVIDTHTAGEPTRIVLNTATLPALEGETMLSRRLCASERWETLRRRLAHEPRGHSEMFGAFVVPAIRPDCEAGILFYDTSGFLPMCVHGSIAVSRVLMAARRSGRAADTLRLDTPAGVIEAVAEFGDSDTAPFITVRNVPSFLTEADQQIAVDGRRVRFDIAFGGNLTALVDVRQLGLDISAECIRELRFFGDALLNEINRQSVVEHPTQRAIHGVTLAYFYQANDDFTDIRSIVVFGGKQVDRSPCGTGSSALLATLFSRGHLSPWQRCVFKSALGSRFTGYVGNSRNFHAGDRSFQSVDPFIGAHSYVTGVNRLVFERADPFKNGFVL